MPHPRTSVPIPQRAFSATVALGGPSDVWTKMAGHRASFSLPKPPASPHILHSLGLRRRNASPRHLCNPKGQLAQPWETVEILTLAINAYKLGNPSFFIMLFPKTWQHRVCLIGNTKDKWLTVAFSNPSISSRALCPSSQECRTWTWQRAAMIISSKKCLGRCLNVLVCFHLKTFSQNQHDWDVPEFDLTYLLPCYKQGLSSYWKSPSGTQNVLCVGRSGIYKGLHEII